MRDILVIGLVFWGAAVAVVHPYIGVLAWTWVSIMNPHRLAWGFAVNFPVAMIVVIGTVLGLLLTRDRRRLTISAPVVVLLLFVLWMCFTSLMAIYPAETGVIFSRVMKIMFMVVVAMAVFNTRKHIDQLVWVLVVSLGFYGLKGGIFTVLTGGGERVWGPAGSFIEGNNELGLALVIAIPLMRYLQLVSTGKWIRIGLGALMAFSALAALGTQSRGAFLAIGAMAALMWVRSERKAVAGILIVTFAAGLIAFMPAQWEERMRSIGVENLDSSGAGRINAWWMAWNLAKDRPIGGGFEVITRELFARYAPDPTDIHAAHSIYFQVLGEHGFVGLFLFLLLWWFVWRWAGRMYRGGGLEARPAWSRHLGGMIQVSLFGYLVGGAFLSLAYFDLPYNLLVLVVVAREVLGEKVAPSDDPARGIAATAAPAPEERRYA